MCALCTHCATNTLRRVAPSTNTLRRVAPSFGTSLSFLLDISQSDLTLTSFPENYHLWCMLVGFFMQKLETAHDCLVIVIATCAVCMAATCPQYCLCTSDSLLCAVPVAACVLFAHGYKLGLRTCLHMPLSCIFLSPLHFRLPDSPFRGIAVMRCLAS
jgi:hypothetical protein